MERTFTVLLPDLDRQRLGAETAVGHAVAGERRRPNTRRDITAINRQIMQRTLIRRVCSTSME